MKNLVLLGLLMLSIYSCNNKLPYQVSGVKISYPNLSEPKELKVIKTQYSDITDVIDTFSFGNLSITNDFSIFIELKNQSANHILFIENTSYRDTISNVLVERNNADEIENFEYRFNGNLSCNSEITIP